MSPTAKIVGAGPNGLAADIVLAQAGFAVEVLRVAARKGSRARHVIFMAERLAANQS